MFCIQHSRFIKSSSPFLVHLCGRITAPHTSLACVLHRLESLSWFCVCAEISRDEEKKKIGRGKLWLRVDVALNFYST